MTVLGTLKAAMCSRQNSMISASLTGAAAGVKSTNAQGVSPHLSWGRATTATSITAGCWCRTDSTSIVEMFSPPEMMMSLDRSFNSM